jgi:hypothetical protein
MKTWNLVKTLLLVSLTLIISCSKDDDDEEKAKPKVSCVAGCSSMSWKISTETGGATWTDNCTNQWIGDEYIQTCDGSVTYEDSDKTYTYHVVYDWIECDITVNVTGVGTCTDNVKSTKSTPCDCGDMSDDGSARVVYKMES